MNKLSLAVLVLLVVAGSFAWAFRRQEPVRRLAHGERDELLRKMQAWVDEGTPR